MKKVFLVTLVCVLVLLFTPMSLAQEGTFIYQLQGVFSDVLQDGRLQIGVLFIVQNNFDIPLYFDAFDVPVLDGEGNKLTTAVLDSCSPWVIMPGEFSYVWCATEPETIASEQLDGIAAPQAECFGFPETADASKELSIADEKCGTVTREDGDLTLRVSATVTNTGSEMCTGSGGFFLIEGTGIDAPFFPIAFKTDAFLGKLAPGESVEIGVELTDLQLYIVHSLGYQAFDPAEFRFTVHAFATKLK